MDRYELVKARLAELKFSEPFPPEATALVDSLSQELIQYCESFIEAKKQLAKRDKPPPGRVPFDQQLRQLQKQLAARDETIADLKRTRLQRRPQQSANTVRLQERLMQKERQVEQLRDKVQVVGEYQQKFQEMQEQIQVLKFENRKYADKMRALQNQLDLNLTQSLDSAPRVDPRVNDRMRELQEELEARGRELADSLRLLAAAREREVESQGLIKQLTMRVEHLSAEGSRLEEQKSELQMLLSSRSKALRQSERSLGQARLMAQEAQAYRSKYEELVQRRVEAQNVEHNSATAQLSKVKLLEHQISNMADQLKKVVTQNQELRIQSKRLSQKEAGLRTLIENGSRKLEEAQLQKHSLLEEIRVLRTRPQPQNQPQDKNQRRLSMVQNEEIKSLRAQLESQRQNSQNQRKSLKELAGQVGRLTAQVQQQEGQRIKLQKYLQQTERINGDQSVRLQEQIRRTEGLTKQRNEALQQCQFVKSLNRQLNKEVDQKTASLIAIDKERDQIQNEVDLKTEENVRLLEEVALYAQENGRLKSLLADSERMNQDYWKRLQRAESVANQLQRKRETLADEKDNFRAKALAKDKEIMQLGSDNSMFLREIQEVKNALNAVDIQRNRLREQNLGLVRELRECGQQIQSLQSERSQAVMALQEAQRRNQQLFLNVQQFQIENQKLGKYAQGLQSQLNYTKTVIAGQQQRKENELTNAVGQLQRRLARTASRNSDLEKINTILGEEKRRLMEEFSQFKKLVAMRQNQQAKGRNEVDIGRVELQSGLERARSQLQLVRAMLQGERGKTKQLQQILRGERRKMAQMARMIEQRGGRQQRRTQEQRRGPAQRQSGDQRRGLEESASSQSSEVVQSDLLRIQRQYNKIMQGIMQPRRRKPAQLN